MSVQGLEEQVSSISVENNIVKSPYLEPAPDNEYKFDVEEPILI